MANGLRSLAWLASLGLAWALAAAPVQAWGERTGPVMVDAKFDFRFDVYTVPKFAPSAPWYTYFPYDPHLMAPPPRSPYPTWPSPFPPGQTPRAGAASPSPTNQNPLIPRNSVIAGTGTQTLQPVGYFFFQTPSYWYGR